MAQENWLSTEEAIHEVVGYCLKISNGSMEMSIRCPDSEVEEKVVAYLKKRKSYPRVSTYVGGANETVKAMNLNGDDTPVKKPPEPEVATPVEETEDAFEGLF